jgi:hypothetical protein
VPYADVERRRRFHREYKRRLRQAKGKLSPLLSFMVFISMRYPNLSLGGGAYFRDGFMVTDDLESQKAVRSHPEFLKTIFPLAIDIGVTPIKED